jgi:hypothetical protein
MAGKPRQNEPLVIALARGVSHAQASRECGVSARTITRRLSDPAFRHRVQAARGVLVERATALLTGSMSLAALTLRRLLKADSEQVRLMAARSVLELGTKLRESVELEDRLSALEQQIEHKHPQPIGRSGAALGVSGWR